MQCWVQIEIKPIIWSKDIPQELNLLAEQEAVAFLGAPLPSFKALLLYVRMKSADVLFESFQDANI